MEGASDITQCPPEIAGVPVVLPQLEMEKAFVR